MRRVLQRDTLFHLLKSISGCCRSSSTARNLLPVHATIRAVIPNCKLGNTHEYNHRNNQAHLVLGVDLNVGMVQQRVDRVSRVQWCGEIAISLASEKKRALLFMLCNMLGSACAERYSYLALYVDIHARMLQHTCKHVHVGQTLLQKCKASMLQMLVALMLCIVAYPKSIDWNARKAQNALHQVQRAKHRRVINCKPLCLIMQMLEQESCSQKHGTTCPIKVCHIHFQQGVQESNVEVLFVKIREMFVEQIQSQPATLLCNESVSHCTRVQVMVSHSRQMLPWDRRLLEATSA